MGGERRGMGWEEKGEGWGRKRRERDGVGGEGIGMGFEEKGDLYIIYGTGILDYHRPSVTTISDYLRQLLQTILDNYIILRKLSYTILDNLKHLS